MDATYLPPVPGCAAEARLREALEKAGWRFTRQRAAVYDYLCSVRAHPTAEEVYLAVQTRLPHISLATVYKALDALVDARLINRVVGEHGPARYDCRREDHYHFRCLKSGAVHDVPTAFDADLLAKLDPNLVAELRRRGFHVTNYRLEVLGYFEAR